MKHPFGTGTTHTTKRWKGNNAAWNEADDDDERWMTPDQKREYRWEGDGFQLSFVNSQIIIGDRDEFFIQAKVTLWLLLLKSRQPFRPTDFATHKISYKHCMEKSVRNQCCCCEPPTPFLQHLTHFCDRWRQKRVWDQLTGSESRGITRPDET